MKILYLTQWFEPEPNIVKGPAFIRALMAAGHDVETVTGFPNYPTGRIYPGYRLRPIHREFIDGVPVVRLPLYPSHSLSSLGRAANFLSFFVSALVYGLLKVGRSDIIYVYHPPITVGLAAALFGWVRRRPFILEIQDLWPDTLAASGMKGTGPMAKLLGPVCDFVYRRAKSIIIQSQGMRDRLVERGVPEPKLTVIRNPADPAALERPQPVARSRLGLGTGTAIVYGGNLGKAQALESAVRAARRAALAGARCELLLMGEGIESERLKALAGEIEADNVVFRAPVPKADVIHVFAAADVLFLQIADDPLFEITIPSKTQFYLAAGKPILAAISGETAEILRESGAAVVVPPNDVDQLTSAMVELSRTSPAELKAMGRRGQEYYVRTFSFEKMVAATLSVIAQAATR